jgi:flagellin
VAGNVTVTQNSLIFQIGPNEEQTSMLSLRDMKPTSLANGISNESNYRSLADLDLTSFQGAQDAIRLIDKAIDETTSFRAGIGAFQTHTLESNLSYLRIATENVIASESLIRDADFAKEMADFTRNQIVQQSAVSMLAQANNHPRSVLALLNS